MSEDTSAVVQLSSEAALAALLATHPAVLVYVHAPDCGVCHVLWPRLHAALGNAYPRLTFARIDAASSPGLAARLMVHAIPAVILYFEGREHHRFAQAFGINEIGAAIGRPYQLLFDNGPDDDQRAVE
jgi:thioredoxin-like negative regulator of GroEL